MIIHQAKSNPQLLDDQIFSERIALLYGPAARCKPNLTELMGLAPFGFIFRSFSELMLIHVSTFC